ncbi:efflux RND transporter permease subunit [Methyloradius palustris]|uniref:ABC transporter permease n=1 Tax=Methyloradius palustris TaxID=2778876 RepID=A0A8D5G1T6_9PROT|nr:efflux RND transporter permease subunit [Methyloradius palustris]BCM24120.1 ABC transporter permease [Methyloradius palustris]
MSIGISSWAIKRPLAPFMVFAGLLVMGIMAYYKLPVNNMPNVDIPIINVSVVIPGAAPSEIETQVTSRIEAAVAGVGDIKHLSSTITDGVSSTQIEFQLGTNTNLALSKIRDQIIAIRASFPRGAEEPLIQRVDADALPILTYTLNAPKRSLQEASWFVDDQVMRSLLAIKGIAKIQRQGGVERQILVQLDPARMQAYGVTASLINEQLRQIALNWPAGRVDSNTQETLIRTMGAPVDVESLANLYIPLGNGRVARLKDLGSVQDGSNQPRQLARLNQQPVTGFAIYRTKSASEISVERDVQKALRGLKVSNPDIDFVQIQSLVDFSKESYHSALWSFIEGALLAAAVVFLFLRSWRATFISAVVIPLSVIPTFFVMQLLGFSLNMVSLLALSLVSGILVDDAIVEIENIMRHMKTEASPYRASMLAADQIGLAVLATTLVIVAVFIPVSFMGGVVGQYFIQFGLTVAVATIFSLLVARFITPVMAAYLLKPLHHQSNTSGGWLIYYSKLLNSALHYRKTMLLIGGAVVFGSIAIGTQLPTDFMPAEDKSASSLQVELPPGSNLNKTDQVVSTITNMLLKRPEVKTAYAIVGAPDSDTNIEGEVRRALVNIQLIPRKERKLDVNAFEQSMLKALADIPNVRTSFLNENGSKAVTFSLTSDNPELLQKTASQIETEMRGLVQLSNVSSTAPLARTELVITPRQEQAAKLGVSTENIADTLRIATLGDLGANLARIKIGQREIPIRVMMDASTRNNTAAIGALLVATEDGHTVPLSSVADFSLNAGPTSIDRYDRQRQITLEANLNGTARLGDALSAIEALPAIKHLPEGVKRYDTGDAELLTEMFSSFSVAMVTGVLLVFAVLVLLFRTIVQPITIMAALPLSIGGALLALLISHATLSLPAVIGMLMLMGIVGKNGILLVDAIIEQRRQGLARLDAIMQASQQRAKPILMTTVAMIAGMMPVMLGIGAGTAFRVPMATTVIGGLITSTALSLIFVPVIYVFLDDFETWIKPKMQRLLGINKIE